MREKGKRDKNVIYEFKALRASEKQDCCEVCRWRPPIALRDVAGSKATDALLHGHHIVPVACDGADSGANLILLCPIHHSIAHYIGKMWYVEKGKPRIWMGPQSRRDFLFSMTMLSKRREYVRYASMGHRTDDYLRLLEEEAQSQDEIEVVRITRSFAVVRGGSVPLYGRRKL